jgi:hypothetical protein
VEAAGLCFRCRRDRMFPRPPVKHSHEIERGGERVFLARDFNRRTAHT